MRDQHGRVGRVAEDAFAATPLHGSDNHRRRFLRSLEEINVIEGSVARLDPDRLDDAARQDPLLRAQPLSLLPCSAPVPERERSGAVPQGYRFIHVVMALDMSPVRLLIGDDVGIGKTAQLVLF